MYNCDTNQTLGNKNNFNYCIYNIPPKYPTLSFSMLWSPYSKSVSVLYHLNKKPATIIRICVPNTVLV